MAGDVEAMARRNMSGPSVKKKLRRRMNRPWFENNIARNRSVTTYSVG